jgi:hypothetical protein
MPKNIYRPNQAYRMARNQLIPKAAAYADKLNGKKFSPKKFSDHFEWAEAWNMDFHKKMNRLAKQVGIV